MSEDQMARDHARDYSAERVFTDAARALEDVLKNETASRRLGANWCAVADDLREQLRERSAQIVRVWD